MSINNASNIIVEQIMIIDYDYDWIGVEWNVDDEWNRWEETVELNERWMVQ